MWGEDGDQQAVGWGSGQSTGKLCIQRLWLMKSRASGARLWGRQRWTPTSSQRSEDSSVRETPICPITYLRCSSSKKSNWWAPLPHQVEGCFQRPFFPIAHLKCDLGGQWPGNSSEIIPNHRDSHSASGWDPGVPWTGAPVALLFIDIILLPPPVCSVDITGGRKEGGISPSHLYVPFKQQLPGCKRPLLKLTRKKTQLHSIQCMGLGGQLLPSLPTSCTAQLCDPEHVTFQLQDPVYSSIKGVIHKVSKYTWDQLSLAAILLLPEC